MTFMAMREFREQGSKVGNLIREKKEPVIITTNGKPSMIVLDVDEDNFEETLEEWREARALRALRELQKKSKIKNPQGLSMEEIIGEIKTTRATR